MILQQILLNRQLYLKLLFRLDRKDGRLKDNVLFRFTLDFLFNFFLPYLLMGIELFDEVKKAYDEEQDKSSGNNGSFEEAKNAAEILIQKVK